MVFKYGASIKKFSTSRLQKNVDNPPIYRDAHFVGDTGTGRS